MHELGSIDRLSIEMSTAVHLIEHGKCDFGHWHEIRPGSTAQFLRSYREFLRRRPGQKLRLIAAECPSCPGCQYDDVALAKDALQAVVCVLPPRARIELRQLLTGLDAEFRRRTFPNPDPNRWTGWDGKPNPWWCRRLYEGD
ncbi:hypothetical protein [Actinomadura alba]|uniref:Uncharacterized protein n=1 Tax=Actinomadura alba TaxID=406431 RepID=A0ABR7LPY3_9ACTN|nr:hypothetical protein [Actinomadura alba]MBC6466909.1 hypothetical protein [Actinomadura alba]